MLKFKLKVKGRGFSIPIPYALIKLSIRIITSKTLQAIANRSIEKKGHTSFRVPQVRKQDFKPLINELTRQKGLTLVEITEKDGTEIVIRL